MKGPPLSSGFSRSKPKMPIYYEKTPQPQSRRLVVCAAVIVVALLTCLLFMARPERKGGKNEVSFLSWMVSAPSLSTMSRFKIEEKDSRTATPPSPNYGTHMPAHPGTHRPVQGHRNRPAEGHRDRPAQGQRGGTCAASIPDNEKFDCYPEKDASAEKCVARGCCWEVMSGAAAAAAAAAGASGTESSLNVPLCFYPLDYPGYVVTGKTEDAAGIVVDLMRNTSTYYPGAIKNLRMTVYMETPERLHVKIVDADAGRYEVPYLNTKPTGSGAKDPMYAVQLPDVGQPFSLSVVRRQTSGDITLLKTAGAFIYNDQFLQLSYRLPSQYIYGLGEHIDTLLHSVQWSRFTMWNKDQPPPIENTNLYGSHPFYMMMEPSGTSHGFFLVNSNAMDVLLQPAPAITWRTIGGVLDFYLFLGPGPDQVIQQYTEVIGRSFMPPYWSLGFHLCRWGYNTTEGTLAVMERVRKAGIPQDVQWNDLDYMDGKKDFSTDWKGFGNQTAMVEYIHSLGMHYVMIVDPGISSNQSQGSYTPYDMGLEMEIFVNDTEGQPIVGKVWPGETVFPDFTNPAAHNYWTSQVQAFHNSVPFDGMWIDMNEISNFVSGSMKGCPKNSTLEYPPYLPAVAGGSLHFNTLCPSAQQYISTHYDLHNMYGFTETMASYEALAAVREKRPFVISRSTFPGQGHYGGHWTGDNAASFWDMYRSISETLSMNMFGITMVGADVCGFRNNTFEQLCQRWHQLGAFYTFSRNHNNFGGIPQDPAAFGEALASSTRKVLLTRYSLLPYLYTLLHKSSAMGHTVLRPLFFEFPQDVVTYGVDAQFLWGPWLLISPVLEENAVTVEGYFPEGIWYDFYNGSKYSSQGEKILLDAPMDKLNLHVRGGGILPMQVPALTTTQSRKNSFQLLVALNETGGAQGDLFWDDGDTIGTHGKGIFNMIFFEACMNTVVSETPHIGYKMEPMMLNNVTVFGVPTAPSSAQVNGNSAQVEYIPQTQVLYVTGFQVTLTQPFKLVWT